jgi:tRNA G37 N-methylase Trm5
LHEWVEQAIAKAFRQVIVVGCAEGYYAVGLARRMPATTVIAFDLDPRAQELCKQMAKLNDVADRVEVRGGATPEILAQLNLSDTFIVCDCEGYENELLDPRKIPQLAGATMLVELHDCFVPGTTDRLKERFSQTHSIEICDMQPRDPANYPVLKQLRSADRAVAVDEDRTEASGRRPHQQWALFQPKASIR